MTRASSSSALVDDSCCGSRLPGTRRLSGWRNRSWRHSRGTQHRPIFLNRTPFDGARRGPWACTGGGRAARPGMFAAYAAWSAREIELQALATLATLAQISTPSAAHFLKSHQLFSAKVCGGSRSAKRPRLRETGLVAAASQRPRGVSSCDF